MDRSEIGGWSLKIIMLLAGAGSRFKQSLVGDMPKPLVSVAGEPLINWAIHNLDCERKHEWLFIVLGEHLHAHPQLTEYLGEAGGRAIIHELAVTTASPVHTLMAAQPLWLDSGPLLLTNCDQFLAVSMSPWAETFVQSSASIGVLTVESADSHFVHLEMGGGTSVSRIVGKGAAELPAAAGYYFFRSGKILADAIACIFTRVKPLHEICVTDIIAAGLEAKMDIRAWSLGVLGEKFIPLGDPSYVKRYEQILAAL